MPVILESRLSWIFLFSNKVVIVVVALNWARLDVLLICSFCHNLISVGSVPDQGMEFSLYCLVIAEGQSAIPYFPVARLPVWVVFTLLYP